MKKILLMVLVITLALSAPLLAVPITDTNGGGLLGTNNGLNVVTTTGVTVREGQLTLAAGVISNVAPANSTRVSLIVQNHGANNVWCGSNAAITALNGPILLPQYGTAILDRSKGAIYCISTAGSTVGYYEEY